MSSNQKQKLLSEFPPVATEKWEEAIATDLKGADYRKKLVWQTGEGFEVRPYYRAEDLAGVKFLAAGIGEFPYARGVRNCNAWRIHQTISVEDPRQANATARKAIAGGAESIGFCTKEDFNPAALGDLMAGIDPAATEMVFCGPGARHTFQPFMELIAARGLDPEQVRVSFVFDPIVNDLSLRGAFTCSEEGTQCFAELAGMIGMGAGLKRAKFVTVNGQRFHNAGSTIVQELAFTLAVGHDYLVKLTDNGLGVDQAARALRFSMAVGANYFMEIAKFRAARLLWANIVSAYGATKSCSEKMRLHAVTSSWNMTSYDSYVNMLRGTTEAMSASIAGVHSLEVLPFDAPYGKPTDFSARIARGVQLLLKNESHFDQVVDPAGGSYYIENLTQSIADQAWKLFKEVEGKGGYIAAFKAGFIQDTIEASAAARDKAVATRRQILLGTNQYPNFSETRPEGAAAKCCGCGDKVVGARVLKPYRGAMAFEALRAKVDASGREPKAFMLTAGSLAMARARSQFACNFFACAGIRVIDNTFFEDVKEGAKAALASGAGIVVLCAADDDYATLAPQVKHLLGGKAILVVAGAPASQPELEAEGITRFISVRSNVLETLTSYVKELNIQ